MLQCKGTNPDEFSLSSYKWAINGNIEQDQSQPTFMLQRGDKPSVTEIKCYGTLSDSESVAVAFFHIIISDEISEELDISNIEGSGDSNKEEFSSHKTYLKEMSLLFKSQDTITQGISLVKQINEGHSVTLVCELVPLKSDEISIGDTEINFQFLYFY